MERDSVGVARSSGRRARALKPEVKIVYVTGRPSNIFAANQDALTFPKPFDVYELAERVRLTLAPLAS
jgi:hypothetical protein